MKPTEDQKRAARIIAQDAMRELGATVPSQVLRGHGKVNPDCCWNCKAWVDFYRAALHQVRHRGIPT